MKVRLFTRSGLTLMLADAEGLSIRELQRHLARGDVCVEPAESPADADSTFQHEEPVVPDPRDTQRLASSRREHAKAAAKG